MSTKSGKTLYIDRHTELIKTSENPIQVHVEQKAEAW